jgi:hypothetical protein
MNTPKFKLPVYFIAILLSISLISCEKEDSIITGRLTYIGAFSGIEYTAPNTTIYLYLGTTNGSPYKTVTSDAQGFFQFHGLWSATWIIYANTTVNGIFYEGIASTTAVDGKNVVTLNLRMQ